MRTCLGIPLFTMLLFSLLSASQPPYIIKHPGDLTSVDGDSALFSVSAGGTAPLSFQWSCDTGAISGATDSVLVLANVKRQISGRKYFCTVSNAFGSNSTRTAELTVKRPSSQLIAISGELYNTKFSMGDVVNVDFVVRLYSSERSDSALYAEYFLASEKRSIKVDRGKFFLRLGEGRTDDNLREVIQSNPNLYVSFSVTYPNGNFETLQPRSPLTSTPYSLAGVPEVLKGNVDPRYAGIEAPIGTHYVDNSTGKTYIKTHNSWSELR